MMGFRLFLRRLLPSRLGLRVKFGLAFVFVSLFCSALLCLGMYCLMKYEVIGIMRGQLVDVASIAATMIKAEDLEKVKTQDDAVLPEYRRVQQTLSTLRKRTKDIANIYTMRLPAEGGPVFIVDEPSGGGKECAPVGEVIADPGGVWERRMRSPTMSLLPHADDFISTDRFGSWLSGFIPLFNSSGRVVAFLGVDMRAEHVGSMQAHLALLSLSLFLAVMPLASLLGWFMGCGMSEPLLRLREGVYRAMNMNFDFIAPKASNDEIGDLTDAFNSMQAKMRTATGQLVESEAKFKGIVSGSPNGILVFNSSLSCVVANPSAARLLGLDESALLLGRDYFSLWTQPSLSLAGDHMRLAKDGCMSSFEAKIARSDSEEGFPVLAVLNPVNLGAAHPDTQLVCILIDISKVEEAKFELERKNEFLRQLIESISYPVFYKDVRGRYLDCNKAFLRLVDKDKDEVIGSTVTTVMAAIQPDSHLAIDSQILSGARRFISYETQIPASDGHFRSYIVHKAAYKTHTGAVGGLVGTMVDITDRKRMEAENKRARASADAANYAKSRFLANVSHEIRTPLNCIVGIVEMLKETSLDKEQAELVSTMEDSGRLLVSVIGDILDLARIESGRLFIEEMPCDLKEVVGSVVRVFEVQASGKGLSFTCEFPESCQSWVFCDGARLRQILTNLLKYAFKFTSKGGVSLKVERSPVDASGATSVYKFSVSDTGAGIDADKLNSIFEGFVQDDVLTNRASRDTGLGLSLCRHLVLLKGGRICAFNNLNGVGSTFSFSLPLRGALEQATVLDDSLAGEPDLAGTRALVADSHGAGAKLLSNILRSFGCECKEASSCADVMDKFETGAFDLLAVDVGLPEGGGVALARKIREDERTFSRRRCFMIAIGSLTDADAQERCLGVGMDAYVTKPVAKAQIALALRNWTRPVQES